MAILLVFHILYISDILIMPHNYDVAMDTGDHVRFTWILYVLGEIPSFGRVVTKCGIYTCIYQTNS